MGVQTAITGITRIRPERLQQLRAVLGRFESLGPDSPINLISTVHFARWVIFDNDTRLLFTTNFDGSWDDYVDEFIDKAADGLDAVWSNCEGFPEGGSRNRAAFKQYVRDSEFPAAVFYSAYPDATVKDVRRALRTRAKFEAFLDEFQ